jgi:hypothetical protein
MAPNLTTRHEGEQHKTFRQASTIGKGSGPILVSSIVRSAISSAPLLNLYHLTGPWSAEAPVEAGMSRIRSFSDSFWSPRALAPCSSTGKNMPGSVQGSAYIEAQHLIATASVRTDEMRRNP